MAAAAALPAYRWTIAFSGALILAIAMGAMVNGLSVFLAPMQDGYGWARGDASLINTCGILGMAFGGAVSGGVADRIGPRPVLLFGAVALGLCYLATGWMTALWQFYALFFAAGFFGAGAIFPSVMALVGNWFTVGAGMAIGIVSAGQALGQGFVPFASSYMIESWGVSGALTATGAAMLATLVPLALLMRAPEQTAGAAAGAPAEETSLPYGAVMLRMCAATVLCCTCMSVPLMHLAPLVTDICGTVIGGGGVVFAMMLSGILGRLVFGKLADMIGAVPAYMAATGWMTIMVFGFVWLESLTAFYVYAVIYGFGYAGVMTGVLTSIRALSPAARRASAMGLVGMFAWFGHAIGGYQGGLLFDLTGAYDAPYAVAAVAGVANLMIVSTLLRGGRRPGRAAVAGA